MAEKDPYVTRDTQITDKGFTARRGREFSYQTDDGAKRTIYEKLPYSQQEIDLWKAQDTTTRPDGSTSTINRDYTKGRFDPGWVDQKYLDTVAQYSGGAKPRQLMQPAGAAKDSILPGETIPEVREPGVVYGSAGGTAQPGGGSQAAPPAFDGGPQVSPPQRELMPVTQQTVQRPEFEAPTTGGMPDPYTTGVTEDQTVAGQIRRLLDADSPYLEQGRQQALEQMSQRGLQNSSMAVQAGEQGRIAAALPIASQDAATYAARSTLNQNTINQFRLNTMDHMQSMIERAQQGNINAQLQLDQYGFSSSLSAQENVQRLEQMAFAGDIDARNKYLDFSYTSMLAGIQQGYALELNDQNFQNSQALLLQEFGQASSLSAQQSQQSIEQMNQGHQNTLDEIAARYDLETEQQGDNLGYQLQAQYLGQVAARQQAASQEIQIIMQTEGLSATQQQNAVRAAEARMRADIEALQAYYAKSPQWDDDFSAVMMPPTTSGGPATPSTGGQGGGGQGGGGYVSGDGDRNLL